MKIKNKYHKNQKNSNEIIVKIGKRPKKNNTTTRIDWDSLNIKIVFWRFIFILQIRIVWPKNLFFQI